MAWSPHLIDLTRPMTRETIIELAGKIVAEDSPYNEVEVRWLRTWDTDMRDSRFRFRRSW